MTDIVAMNGKPLLLFITRVRKPIIRQMSETQGVTKQLKTDNQMLRVGRINNICACDDEIIRNEIIYQ